MIAIPDSGTNIHLARQAIPTMVPVIMINEMKSRLTDGITRELTYIATHQIPGLLRLARQIHILPKIQISQLISLVVLCDYG